MFESLKRHVVLLLKVSPDRLFLYIYTLQSDTLFVCHVVTSKSESSCTWENREILDRLWQCISQSRQRIWGVWWPKAPSGSLGSSKSVEEFVGNVFPSDQQLMFTTNLLSPKLDIRKQALTLIEVNDAKCARTGVALNPWQPQNACGNSGNVKIGARSCTFCVSKVERLSREVALPTSWMLINCFKCACHYLFQCVFRPSDPCLQKCSVTGWCLFMSWFFVVQLLSYIGFTYLLACLLT